VHRIRFCRFGGRDHRFGGLAAELRWRVSALEEQALSLDLENKASRVNVWRHAAAFTECHLARQLR
jgi:hypothetical protein